MKHLTTSRLGAAALASTILCSSAASQGQASALSAEPTRASQPPLQVAPAPLENISWPASRTYSQPGSQPWEAQSRTNHASAFVSSYCYVNTDTSGLFGVPDPGEELVDFGILGGTAATKCAGLSPIVTSVEIGYATSALDPALGGPGASLALTFYTSYLGFGADSGNCPVATFSLSGLPGNTGGVSGLAASHILTLDLTGGSEFCMPDGNFGFGYRGTDGLSGPLLCFTTDGAGGPEPCTGTLDVLDVWTPDTKGTHSLLFFGPGTGPTTLSHYAKIARADLSASPAGLATRNAAPNPADSLACTSPVLGETLTATVTAPIGYLSAFCFAFDSPVQIALGGGQVLLCLDLGGQGELLSGAGLPTAPIAPGPGGEPRFELEVPIPKNVDFCGFTFCMQALCAFGVTPFALTSACDLTVGG